MRKILSWSVLALVALGTTVSPALAQEKKKPDPEAQFKRLDANSDGKLTLEEFTAKRKDDATKERAKKQFAQLDKNSDGNVTLEEFKARAKKK
jgi:Ca2+-binding EF-hand superfamily protein